MPYSSSTSRPGYQSRDFCRGPAFDTRQEPAQQVPSGPPSVAYILFKKKYYSAEVLYAVGRTGIRIKVKPEEWHKDKTLVDSVHSHGLDEAGSLVVVQYEGQYVPVTGSKSHAAAMEKGEVPAYLLSNVILKKSYLHDAN